MVVENKIEVLRWFGGEAPGKMFRLFETKAMIFSLDSINVKMELHIFQIPNGVRMGDITGTR